MCDAYDGVGMNTVCICGICTGGKKLSHLWHNKWKQEFIATKHSNVDKLVVGKLLKRNIKYMGDWVSEPNKFLWKVD